MPSPKKYQVIAEELTARLVRGDYPCGAKLPSERRLVREFGVTLITVRHALDQLETNGLVSREQGRGTYVLRQTDDQTKPPRCLAFVLADHPRHPFYDETLRVLERLTAKRHWHLTFAILRMDEAGLGKLPLALRRSAAAGVFLDGAVQDHHVTLLKAHAIPTVVMGCHCLHLPCVRVTIDLEQAGYLLTRQLLLATAGPAVLVTEPFRLEQSHDVLAGYRRACHEQGRQEWVIPVLDVPERETEDHDLLQRCLKTIQTHYGLFLCARVGASLQALLKGRYRAKNRIPIFCLGNPGLLHGDGYPPIITHRLEQVPLLDTAVEVMERLLADRVPDGTTWVTPEWQPGFSGAPLDGRLIWRRAGGPSKTIVSADA